MLVLFRFFGVLLVLTVIQLQHPSVCRAAETTEQSVSGTLYGGAGSLSVPNNEVQPAEYQIQRMGIGVLGIVRFGSGDASGTPIQTSSGFFLAMGGAFELDRSLQTVCGYECYPSGPISETREHYLGKHFAGRFGAGYSLPLFEFRVGGLFAVPDSHVTYAMPLVFPDVLASIGRRQIGWFEIGLGAYSASTNFRPGLFLGGALGPERLLQVSGHVGLHFVNGLCCATVVKAGYAGELSVAHAFSSSLTASVAVTVFDGSTEQESHYVTEGSSRLAFAF
ncbi:MAG: hypothetical protein ABW061_28220 [Polyangiaceae bacterium]